MDRFDDVQPGHSWWWWFREQGKSVVRQVARDGSGGLWTDIAGHGKELAEYMKEAVPLGPVSGVISSENDWSDDPDDELTPEDRISSAVLSMVVAVEAMLLERPMLSGRRYGSTTLGNHVVELKAAAQEMGWMVVDKSSKSG